MSGPWAFMQDPVGGGQVPSGRGRQMHCGWPRMKHLEVKDFFVFSQITPACPVFYFLGMTPPFFRSIYWFFTLGPAECSFVQTTSATEALLDLRWLQIYFLSDSELFFLRKCRISKLCCWGGKW